MLLAAKIDPDAADSLAQNLESADVPAMLEQAAEIVADWEQDAPAD